MKILTISSCKDCPYFKADPDNRLGIEDTYIASCHHPDTEPFYWDNKIRNNHVEPPPRCPLSDISEYTQSDY